MRKARPNLTVEHSSDSSLTLDAQSRILLNQAARLCCPGSQSSAVSGRMWQTSAFGRNKIMTKKISEERKTACNLGMGMTILGGILFASMFAFDNCTSF